MWFVLNIISTLKFSPSLKLVKKYKNSEDVDDYVHEIVKTWSKNVLNKLQVNVTLKGEENIPDCPCLFVSNHQGNFDYLVMLSYIDKPFGFVAKSELEKIPIFSKWMNELHCVFMNRKSLIESAKAIDRGVENLKNRHSMMVFPEGTISRKHEMLKFKRGSFKLALRSGVPIIPVAIDGAYKIFKCGSKKIMPADVSLTISRPIAVKSLSMNQKKQLPHMVKSIIEDTLSSSVQNPYGTI